MRKVLVLAFVAAFAWAGCGSDDGGGGKVDSAAKASSASGSDTGATSSTGAGTDFSGKGSAGFCVLARRYGTDFKDTGQAKTPAEVKKEYTALTAAVARLAAQAPAEIKPDTQKVSGAFKDVDALLAKYGYEFSKVPEAEAQAMDLTSPEIQASSSRVESYFETVCKIDADGDGDTDGVTAPDTSTTGVTTETTSPG